MFDPNSRSFVATLLWMTRVLVLVLGSAWADRDANSGSFVATLLWMTRVLVLVLGSAWADRGALTAKLSFFFPYF